MTIAQKNKTNGSKILETEMQLLKKITRIKLMTPNNNILKKTKRVCICVKFNPVKGVMK